MRHMLGSQSGVIRGSANECEVFADSTGMQVKVKTGEAFIRGHYAELTSEKTLPIATAHATLPRIDRVVLRADFVNNRIELDVLTGTAAGSPGWPGLTQTTSVWEVSLGLINVPAADTSIDAGQVTYNRQYTSAHGKWTGVAQSLPNNIYTKISYDAAVYDSGDIAADLANEQFMLLRSGLWIIQATCRFTGNATGKRELLIADPADVSGATCSNVLASATDGAHANEVHLTAVSINRFLVSQMVAAFAYQISGAALNTIASGNAITFSTMWVGP